MNFGEALENLKDGYKVARKGWNGKGMFIYLTQERVVPYSKADLETQKAYIAHDKSTVTYRAHINMRATDGSIVVGWLASQTDMLSDDWEIVN